MDFTTWITRTSLSASRRARPPLVLEALEERSLLSAGALDPSFGSGGTVVAAITPAVDYIEDLVVQPDGKIVAAGVINLTNAFASGDFGVARYNTDGTLDASFGSGGRATTNFTGGRATAVVRLPDGRLVAGGMVMQGLESLFALARYTPGGVLDTTFGAGGKVTTAYDGQARISALAVQADGKVVAGGTTFVDRPGDGGFGDFDFGGDDDFALARYNPDGTLDSTFGSGGKVSTDFTPPGGSTGFGDGSDEVRALAIQPDGKIVAAGSSYSSGAANFSLSRYNPDGSLDFTFGSGGKVQTDFGGNDRLSGIALLPDGRIVAAGSTSVGATSPENLSNIALVRYNPDGSLDTTFGSGGKVNTDVGRSDAALSLVRLPNGMLVTAGVAHVGGGDQLTVTRYRADGSLDTAFGSGGTVSTAFSSDSVGFAVALQSDGKVVAAGALETGDTQDWVLARFQGDQSIPVNPPDPGPAPTAPLPSPSSSAVRSIAAAPVWKGAGSRRKWFVRITDGLTGEVLQEVLMSVPKAAGRGLRVTAVDSNGDGVTDTVVVRVTVNGKVITRNIPV